MTCVKDGGDDDSWWCRWVVFLGTSRRGGQSETNLIREELNGVLENGTGWFLMVVKGIGDECRIITTFY